MSDARPDAGRPDDAPEAEEAPKPPAGPIVALTVGVGVLVALLLVLFELFVAR